MPKKGDVISQPEVNLEVRTILRNHPSMYYNSFAFKN